MLDSVQHLTNEIKEKFDNLTVSVDRQLPHLVSVDSYSKATTTAIAILSL